MPLEGADVSFERVCRRVYLHCTLVPIKLMKEQHAFAVKAYFTHGRSVVATQREYFDAQLHIAARSRVSVPRRQPIVMWESTFRENGVWKREDQGQNGPRDRGCKEVLRSL